MGERGLNRQSVSAYFSDRDPVRGQHIPLKLHGEHTRVTVGHDFRQIEEVVGPLPPPIKDLIDLAAAAYMADMFIPPDDSFFRELDLTVEVRDSNLWESLVDPVERTLSFLFRSPVHVSFVAGKEPPRSQKASERVQFDAVVCLSGGLDSYVGALTMKGQKLLFISQFNSTQLAGLQSTVASRLLEADGDDVHLRVNVGQERGASRKSLGSQKYAVQPSRSFLFLALAGAAAIVTEAKQILMFENGPMALGVPYTPSRFNTRTVHPVFLDMMQQILQRMPNGGSVQLENPFQEFTKAEILSRAPRSDLIRALPSTCSCSRRWRVRIMKKNLKRPGFKGWHCGICLPCVHRQLAVLRAGLSDHDDEYLVDVLHEYPFEDPAGTTAAEALINVRDLVVFAWKFRDWTNEDLLSSFPDLIFDSDRMTPIEAIRTYRRMADDVLQTLAEHGNTELRTEVAGL